MCLKMCDTATLCQKHLFCVLIFFSQEYKLLFEGAGSNPGDKTLEDRFFEHEVSMIMKEDRGDNELSEVKEDQKDHSVCFWD